MLTIFFMLLEIGLAGPSRCSFNLPNNGVYLHKGRHMGIYNLNYSSFGTFVNAANQMEKYLFKLTELYPKFKAQERMYMVLNNVTNTAVLSKAYKEIIVYIVEKLADESITVGIDRNSVYINIPNFGVSRELLFAMTNLVDIIYRSWEDCPEKFVKILKLTKRKRRKTKYKLWMFNFKKHYPHIWKDNQCSPIFRLLSTNKKKFSTGLIVDTWNFHENKNKFREPEQEPVPASANAISFEDAVRIAQL